MYSYLLSIELTLYIPWSDTSGELKYSFTHLVVIKSIVDDNFISTKILEFRCGVRNQERGLRWTRKYSLPSSLSWLPLSPHHSASQEKKQQRRRNQKGRLRAHHIEMRGFMEPKHLFYLSVLVSPWLSFDMAYKVICDKPLMIYQKSFFSKIITTVILFIHLRIGHLNLIILHLEKFWFL